MVNHEVNKFNNLLVLDNGLKKNIIPTIIISLLAGILYDFGDRFPFPIFLISQVFTILIILAPLFFPRKLIILPLIFLITVCPDLTYVSEDSQYYGHEVVSASPWQFWLLGISPATLLLFNLFIVVVRINRNSIKKNELIIFVYFFIIQGLVFIVNKNYYEPLDRIFTDIKVGMYFLLGLRVFQLYFSKFQTEKIFIFQIFFLLILVRFTLDLFYLVFDVPRTFISGFNRISVDSTKGILLFVIFVALAKTSSTADWRMRLFYSFLSAAFSFLLFSYQTRWLILVFILGLLIYFYTIGLKRSFLFFLSNFFVIAIIVAIISSFLPYVFDVVWLRFSSTFNASSLGIEQVDVTRVGSIVNAVEKLKANNGFLFGMGYGSYFTDEHFPFLNLTDQDFGTDSLSTGKYYRVHDFVFHFLFKYGVFGILIFSYVALQKPFVIFLHRKVPRMKEIQYHFLIYALLATIPFIVTSLYWTAKGLLVMTFFISFCDYILSELLNENRS